MIERGHWEVLQERWACGDELTPSEEALRQGFIAVDAVARREQEFFDGLRGCVDEPFDEYGYRGAS